jgi:hypothetical protein
VLLNSNRTFHGLVGRGNDTSGSAHGHGMGHVRRPHGHRRPPPGAAAPGEAPGAAASAAPRETRPASLEAPDCSTPSLSALNRIIFCISRFRCVVSRYICLYPDRIYREIYWDPADAGAGDSGTGRRRAVIRSPSLESRPVPCGSRAELGDLRVSPTGRRTPVQPAGEPTCAGSRLDDLPWRAVHRTHRVVHIERQSSVPHDT